MGLKPWAEGYRHFVAGIHRSYLRAIRGKRNSLIVLVLELVLGLGCCRAGRDFRGNARAVSVCSKRSVETRSARIARERVPTLAVMQASPAGSLAWSARRNSPNESRESARSTPEHLAVDHRVAHDAVLVRA